MRKIIQRVGELFEMRPRDILHPGKQPKGVQARSLICYWAGRKRTGTQRYRGRRLGLSQSAVSRAIARGQMPAEEAHYLIEKRNA